MANVQILERIETTYTMYGVPTTVDETPYILITHMTAPPFISCQQVDETRLISPANLPPAEDPQGECGFYPPFQRFRFVG